MSENTDFLLLKLNSGKDLLLFLLILCCIGIHLDVHRLWFFCRWVSNLISTNIMIYSVKSGSLLKQY